MAESARAAEPTFVHHDKIRSASDHLFGIFQMPDPAVRRALLSSVLVRNAIVLLSSTYGTGKTQLVELIRNIFFSDGAGGSLFDYESCHQELTAFDVLYHLDLAELQKGREVVHPKAMVTARLKFLNEIQRASTGFFNALLPLLAERRITYRDVEFAVPDFVCFMDRNPLDVGSNEIPEAFLDRIDFSFEIQAIHLEELLRLQELREQPGGMHWGGLDELARPTITFAELEEVWNDVGRVLIPRRTTIFAGMLSDALRLCIVTERSTARPDFDLSCHTCQFAGEICSHLLKVPAQRVTNSALRLAQALAWFSGKGSVSEEDVLEAFPWCLSHRLSLRPEDARTKPSEQAWVRETAIGEILRPKLPHWQRALDALQANDTDSLAELGKNDLVVRELELLATTRAAQ